SGWTDPACRGWTAIAFVMPFASDIAASSSVGVFIVAPPPSCVRRVADQESASESEPAGRRRVRRSPQRGGRVPQRGEAIAHAIAPIIRDRPREPPFGLALPAFWMPCV